MKYTPGLIRPCANFASCAGEPCDNDAEFEAAHAPEPDVKVWVPLCEPCFSKAPVEGLAYIIETHGFVPPLARDA